MNFEQVQKLFDSFWFEHQIFSSKPPISNSNQPVKNVNEEFTTHFSSPSFLIRSFSDQNLNSIDINDISPTSVLQLPKLQTIQSGKEFGEVVNNTQKEMGGSKKRNKRGSKSLSELEIEELKGFMDLGFEFKDEDKDSSLVLIVPGLQRLGKEQEGNKGEENRVSRPYLSEAWDALEKKKNQKLMDWRLPAFGNEVELKNHLKSWAHTIASNVR